MRGNIYRIMTLLAIMPLLLTGCLFGPEPQEIDPPPDTAAVDGSADGEGEGGAVESDQGPGQTEGDADEANEDEAATSANIGVELYFAGPEGYVVPYNISVEGVEGIAKESLNYMIKGKEAELPEGFTALLPEGTEVMGMDIENGVATVDFSNEFLNYEAKDEQNILSAVTWALTAWDSIDKVNLWVNGHPLDYMPEARTPATDMTRANTAINVEVAEGVQLSNSMPVTLYFLGQTGEEIYHVPVTRMVPRSKDKAEIVMQELINGPVASSNLSTDILDTLEINEIAVKEDVVVADVGEQLLQYGQEKQASQRAIDSIVLSLTENTGLAQVQLTVNGEGNVSSDSQLSLAEPVSRPDKINTTDL